MAAFNKRRKWVLVLLAVMVIAGTVMLLLNLWVTRSARGAVFTQVGTVPDRDVALVLGTGKLLRNGRPNVHFHERMVAGAELYNAGKVRHLLLSGDNHITSYDEPSDMREALMALGVPDSAMTLDYAGFRTLDSVVRARKIFGLTSLTIVTDDFHAARAVFLARHSGVDAVAFCSAKVPLRRSARARVREIGARVKALLDVYVLRTQPHFLGEPVEIHVAAGRGTAGTP